MNRHYLFATLALLVVVALGCTREKPFEPDPTPPPLNVVIRSTPIPVAPAGVSTNPAPTSAITTTAPITTTGTTETPAPPVAAAPVTPTLSLPPGIFSPIQPLSGPTTSAPSTVAATQTPGASLAPAAGPSTYTVQWGDWLSKIARQFGVSNEALIAANPGMNPNLLIPGQVLNIPGSGGNATPGATPTSNPSPGGATTYTVQRGDWFYAIARKFGVTFEALLAANPGVRPNFVFPGQLLNIPASAPGPNPTITPGGATPTANPTITPGGRPSRYTVQQGDTLYSIAVRFNTTTYALQIVNHLPSPHFIFVGQVLVIPK